MCCVVPLCVVVFHVFSRRHSLFGYAVRSRLMTRQGEREPTSERGNPVGNMRRVGFLADVSLVCLVPSVADLLAFVDFVVSNLKTSSHLNFAFDSLIE